MSAALAVAFAAGGLLKAYSDKKAAEAEAKAARAQAEAKRAQAAEMLIRTEENIFATIIEGEEFKSEQQLSFAKSGVALGEGTPLSVLEDTSSRIENNVAIQRREALYKAEAIRRGADIDTQLAGDIEKAGKYKMWGQIFSTGASAASAYNGGK